MTINENEGHGRLDGFVKGPKLENIPVCRFKFPKFPLDETKVILGLTKDTNESVIKERKKDLNKIVSYIIRQTYLAGTEYENKNWKQLKNQNFWTFLYSVGMFVEDKPFEAYSEEEKNEAKLRYTNALSAAVQGSAMVVLKREVKDLFINGYNKKIMRIFKANHDLQICIDQYSVAQYICGYLTKNEEGM